MRRAVCVKSYCGWVPGMNVPESMQHRLDPADCIEKLPAACAMPGTGSLVEDAEGRAMGEENIRIGRDPRVELRPVPFRNDPEGFSQEELQAFPSSSDR